VEGLTLPQARNYLGNLVLAMTSSVGTTYIMHRGFAEIQVRGARELDKRTRKMEHTLMTYCYAFVEESSCQDSDSTT